jgi:hypothetical protein
MEVLSAACPIGQRCVRDAIAAIDFNDRFHAGILASAWNDLKMKGALLILHLRILLDSTVDFRRTHHADHHRGND